MTRTFQIPAVQAGGLLIGLIVVGSLFIFASAAGGDMDMFGLSDEAIHNIAHLTVWSLVAAVLYCGLGGQLRFAGVIALLIAGAEELHQAIVPFRTVSLQDYLLNVIAISTTLAVIAIVRHVLARETESDRPVAAA